MGTWEGEARWQLSFTVDWHPGEKGGSSSHSQWALRGARQGHRQYFDQGFQSLLYSYSVIIIVYLLTPSWVEAFLCTTQ